MALSDGEILHALKTLSEINQDKFFNYFCRELLIKQLEYVYK